MSDPCPMKPLTPRELDSSATTILTHVDMAVTALQDIFPMPVTAQFTSEPPASTLEDLHEATRVLAFIIVYQVSLDLLDTALTLSTRKPDRSYEIHNLFGSLQNASWIRVWALA